MSRLYVQGSNHPCYPRRVKDPTCANPHEKRKAKLLANFGKVKQGAVIEVEICLKCGVVVKSRDIGFEDAVYRVERTHTCGTQTCTDLTAKARKNCTGGSLGTDRQISWLPASAMGVVRQNLSRDEA